MKLLKLYSSNPKFKTITFKPGLNVIAGLQASTSKTDSYNGIGKSTSLQLVHLLLGGTLDSKKYKSDEVLEVFLSGYGDFFLDFSVGTVNYTAKVNFSDKCYYLNEKKIGGSTTFSKHLKTTILKKPSDHITFKQVLNCFARRYMPSRDYYSGELQQQARPFEDFNQKLANIILLGLDPSLPKKFKKKCDELQDKANTLKALKKANLTENESELRDLEDKLKKLVRDKNNFIIAKNYDLLKQEADSLTSKMNELRNQIFSNERNIQSKNQILKSSSDVKSVELSKVEDIFKEANFHFPELVAKRLEQAEEFHLKVHEARKSRLQDQILELRDRNADLNSSLSAIEITRDSILKDLDSKGALEEYNSLVEHIRTIESTINELTSFQAAVNQAEKDHAKLDSEKAQIKVEAVQYIDDNKEKLKDIETLFRSLVLQFYKDHGGALRISKNAGEAKYLFDIAPYIQKDTSQGVNEVKVFCYDMLLFLLNPKLLGFMAHDSRIFSGMDPRQIRTMFKIVLETCKSHDLQYFVNINRNTYEDVVSDSSDIDIDENPLSSDERASIITNTILELYDGSPENTLFGEIFG